VPFDLTTIDSSSNKVVLVKRIINIGKESIAGTGKLKDASSVMLAKLLTRPDVVKSGETDILMKEFATIFDTNKDD
jgi:hypothetical protein